ncbi:MAG TPA: DUF305 domain-containing protein [Pyrinomonadaceae bacterium]|nr:DUF305 domain-containing protein [Pyrinomonadaceae bacterium]
MPDQSTPIKSFKFNAGLKLRSAVGVASPRGRLLAAVAFACCFSLPVSAQREVDSKSPPVVVQPGAPGQPTRTLPLTTRATLPPRSAKDVEFMQGMIMHHAQAVEMTALIESHTQDKEIRLLGARISQSQSDEMKFMKRWLEIRGEPVSPPMPEMPGHDMSGHDMSSHHMLMPGMLTAKQMDALRKATGAEFDRLFLAGMIQHHEGALAMVKDLFDTAGAGQDAELFNFATDVDSGQRAEIRIMQIMLGEKPIEEKR